MAHTNTAQRILFFFTKTTMHLIHTLVQSIWNRFILSHSRCVWVFFMIENWGLLYVTRGNNDVSRCDLTLAQGVTSFTPAAIATIAAVQAEKTAHVYFVTNGFKNKSFDGSFVIFNHFIFLSLCVLVNRMLFIDVFRCICKYDGTIILDEKRFWF